MASIKYQENGEIKDLTLKIGDTLPIGTEVDYDGDTVPTGWEEVAEKGYFAESWYNESDQTISNNYTEITGFNKTITTTGGDILVTMALACNLTQDYTGSIWVYLDGTRITTKRICTCKGTNIFNYFGQLLLTNVSAGQHTIAIYGRSDSSAYNLVVKGIYNKAFSAIEL